MEESAVLGRIFKMTCKSAPMSHQLGAGLAEAIIAVCIIAISVVALARFQAGVAYSDTLAQQQSEATILAESELESLRDFQVISNQAGYTSYQSIASGTSTVTGTNATYTLTWTITSYVNPSYKNMDITVSWTDKYGIAQSTRLVTNVGSIDPVYSGIIIY